MTQWYTQSNAFRMSQSLTARMPASRKPAGRVKGIEEIVMKSRLLYIAAALLLLSSCASGRTEPADASPSPPDLRSPSPDVSVAGETSPSPSASPSDELVTITPQTSPPMSESPPQPSPTPSPSEEPSPSPSPSEASTPSAPEWGGLLESFSGQISPDAPECTFELRLEERDGVYRCATLLIDDGAQFSQEIVLSDFSTDSGGISSATRDMGFLFQDMNYDGYMDFLVRDFVTSTPNHQYLVFLWSPATEKYVFSSPLSALSNPEFDEDAQLVRSKIIVFPDIVDSEYNWENGRFLLQKETMSHYNDERSLWEVTVSLRVDGVLTVVDRYDEENDPYGI